MNCIEEGTLRAFMDQELAAFESQEVDRHLTVCATCRKRSDGIAAHAKEVATLLGVEAGGVDPVLAYGSYRQSVAQRPEPRSAWTAKLFSGSKRPAWAGIAGAAVVVGLLSFAPARIWGQKILEMLRVQKVAVVPVDVSAMNDGRMEEPGKGLAQLISDSVVVTMKPGAPVAAPSIDAADGLAGFKVRSLDGLGAPAKILINGEGAFHMTLNRDRIETVLDAAGRSDIQIPQSIDGSTIAVHISKMARLLYGDCSTSTQVKKITGNCLAFMQVPSPTISVPPGLNVGELAEAGLQVFGMSAAEAHAFSQTVDWSSTLVIPIPQKGSSSRPISVDGVTGTLVEVASRDKLPGNYSLVWVKNGIVYALTGNGDSNQALAAAGSLN